MNVLFLLLISIAVAIGLGAVGFLLIWLRGIGALAFPGAGFGIATPALVILLNLMQLIIVVVAMFVGRHRAGVNEFTLITITKSRLQLPANRK